MIKTSRKVRFWFYSSTLRPIRPKVLDFRDVVLLSKNCQDWAIFNEMCDWIGTSMASRVKVCVGAVYVVFVGVGLGVNSYSFSLCCEKDRRKKECLSGGVRMCCFNCVKICWLWDEVKDTFVMFKKWFV